MKSTKELAQELGLLRKRSKKGEASREVRRANQTNQCFSYLIVIDYEATCWEDRKCRQSEIIEFPAVLLNTINGKIEDQFHYYVQPQENPVLSEFCRRLTGITQGQVDEGVSISQCIQRFRNWLTKIATERDVIYNRFEEKKKSCTFVTWSDWDFGVCLEYECRRKQLRKPQELDTWIDLRATYRKFYGRKPQGLNGALKDLGISFEGREHSGLDDAINTAKLAWRMMSDGCVMQVTKSKPVQNQVIEHIKKMKEFVSKIGSTGPLVQSAPKPYCNEKATATRSPTLLPTQLTPTNSGVTRKRPFLNIPGNHCDTDIKAKLSRIDNPGQRTTNCDPFAESKNDTFKTPELPPSHANHLTSIASSTISKRNVSTFVKENVPWRTQNESANFFTPSNNSSYSASNSMMKRTPPMCGCGRRAHRKIVQSPGPNQGRIFFCCPGGKRKTAGCFGLKDGQSGCGYFKWEKPASGSSCNKSALGSSSTMSFHKAGSSVPRTPIAQPNFNTPNASGIPPNITCRKKTLGVLRLSQSKS